MTLCAEKFHLQKNSAIYPVSNHDNIIRLVDVADIVGIFAAEFGVIGEDDTSG